MAIADHWVTTKQAAEIIGVSDIRVRQLFRHKRIKGERIGAQIMLDRDAVKEFSEKPRLPGRRPKINRGRR